MLYYFDLFDYNWKNPIILPCTFISCSRYCFNIKKVSELPENYLLSEMFCITFKNQNINQIKVEKKVNSLIEISFFFFFFSFFFRKHVMVGDQDQSWQPCKLDEDIKQGSCPTYSMHPGGNLPKGSLPNTSIRTPADCLKQQGDYISL